ncbi:type II secretion system protein GspG [Verrucomicrobiales bacterium]|nr:type II secretion system protein GspG [Verrucomicrobiales bacterium]
MKSVTSDRNSTRNFLFHFLYAVLGSLPILLASCNGGSSSKVEDQKARAYVAKANSDLKQIALALKFYHQEAGEYPATEAGLNELTGHLPTIPKDPWKRDYHYKKENGEFSLWSTGPSEEDETDDIRFVPEK